MLDQNNINIPSLTDPQVIPVNPTTASEVVVASPGNNRKVSVWFLLLLIVTALGFIGMTFLLIKSLQSKPTVKVISTPEATPSIVNLISPSIIPTESLPSSPTPEIKKMESSDEIDSIENDLSETTFDSIDRIVETNDRELGFTSN